MADQFLQIAFKISAQRVYGPGEVRSQFPNPLSTWTQAVLWARDQAPSEGTNLYGVHNFILGLNGHGAAFGIFLLNSNAQEVVLSPLPAVTYRTIGGIFDFFIFTGPKPADVVAQYMELIGRPPLPPYWSLGFHMSKYGYRDVPQMSKILQRNINFGIPVDVQWADIDYMDKWKDWTVDDTNFRLFKLYVDDFLHNMFGMRLIVIVDPAISTQGGPDYKPYNDGLTRGIFINDSKTELPLKGKVWPGETVFPDFAHPQALDWWLTSAKEFHEKISFDGLWIDMNEPSNFVNGSIDGCEENKLNNPPYIPAVKEGSLMAKTICPSAQHYLSTHYNMHNLYAYYEAKVTFQVLNKIYPGKRPFILSRSSFSGSQSYTAHWTGDNQATWEDLRYSIRQIMNFNIFGLPFIGADICGFYGKPTQELCIRWYQVGAFYPFMRTHSDISSTPTDPYAWGSYAAHIMKDALQLRYHLLPYLYSLFYRAHLNGTTVVRPLSFEFDDPNVLDVDSQFLLGPDLLISPVLYEGRTYVHAYVPAGEWINLATKQRIFSKGEQFTLDAPIDVIPVLVRTGSIIPVQLDTRRTSMSRLKGLGLWIFLPSTGRQYAEGELFWDNGIRYPTNYYYVKYQYGQQQLSGWPTLSDPGNPPKLAHGEDQLKHLIVHGLGLNPERVFANDRRTHTFQYDPDLDVLSIYLREPLVLSKPFTIHWEF